MTFRIHSAAVAKVRALDTAAQLYALASLIHSGTAGVGARQTAGAVLTALARIVQWGEDAAGVEEIGEGGCLPSWWVDDGRGELRWAEPDRDGDGDPPWSIGRALHEVLTADDAFCRPPYTIDRTAPTTTTTTTEV